MIVPFDDAASLRAAELLREGRLVAFPTETVYGLGARADSSAAVRRIYEAKGRPAENPSIVHLPTAEAAFALARAVPPEARALAATFWPGPLTIVLPVRAGAAASEALAGGDTIALRVPAHPAAQAILSAAGVPVAAPSANRSTSISPTTAAHVERSLGARVDLVVDAGPTGFGIESTIVDLASDPPRLLRRGSVSFERLRVLVPAIADAGAIVTPSRERAPAPGTSARHYAPSTELVLVSRAELDTSVERCAREGRRCGVLAFDAVRGASASEVAPRDPAGYAQLLYAALHRLDDAGCDVLFAEEPPDQPSWAAVRDRLRRASAPGAK